MFTEVLQRGPCSTAEMQSRSFLPQRGVRCRRSSTGTHNSAAELQEHLNNVLAAIVLPDLQAHDQLGQLFHVCSPLLVQR